MSSSSFASAPSVSLSFYDRMPINETKKATTTGKDISFQNHLEALGFNEKTEVTQLELSTASARSTDTSLSGIEVVSFEAPTPDTSTSSYTSSSDTDVSSISPVTIWSESTSDYIEL
uniref:Uncharacterized protein n=1 Tax=Steinernema glaseri TaxID=37863 RepID=A0A1I8A500_9BILA